MLITIDKSRSNYKMMINRRNVLSVSHKVLVCVALIRRGRSH